MQTLRLSGDPALVVVLIALVQRIYIFDHTAGPEIFVSIR